MTRVQIPAYTDRWMMGDRFGEVVSIKMARPKNGRTLLLTNGRNQLRLGDIEIASVKLDKSGKIVRVVLADCEVVS
jgi:hypothetical protein